MDSTSGHVRIRPATLQDLVAVLSMYRDLEEVYQSAAENEAGNEGGEEVLWEKVAADPRQHILVAEQDGRIVGSLTVVVVPNLGHRGRPWMAVENVVVDREVRGQGVGTALMRHAEEVARAHGCYKVVLTSNLNRLEAHGFYEKLGWRLTHAGFSVEMGDG